MAPLYNLSPQKINCKGVNQSPEILFIHMKNEFIILDPWNPLTVTKTGEGGQYGCWEGGKLFFLIAGRIVFLRPNWLHFTNFVESSLDILPK